MSAYNVLIIIKPVDFLTLSPPNYPIWIFTHLKLCLADAIHNFKWVKIIQIWKMEVNSFQILLIGVTFYI